LQAAAPQAKVRFDMKAKTILLVDDHALVRRGIRSMIDGNYMICGEAENGREAIDMAQALKPDLILMDVSMPVIGGIEATRQIRVLLPKTKITTAASSSR
jgi:two-component system, NarL family, nitrate/nitrite response regulator NarL